MDQFLSAQLARAAILATSHLIAANSTLDLEPTGSTLEQSVPVVESRAVAISPERSTSSHARPMASLPGEEVAAVQVHGYTNGLRQDIMLRGSAQRGVKNSMTILVQISHQPTLDEQVPMVQPTEAGIRSEIGGQFPHLSMQVVERQSSNAYGPYGLAIGRVGSEVRCVYMWQWIDANRLSVNTAITGPVSVRVRLCKTGTTFDAMAAELDHFRVEDAVPGDVASNEPSGIIEAPLEEGSPARVHNKPSHRAARAHRPRHIARPAATQEPAPIAAAAGPRYMNSIVGPSAPSPAMAPTPSAAQQLSGDLPAEAYQGPTAKTAPTKIY